MRLLEVIQSPIVKIQTGKKGYLSDCLKNNVMNHKIVMSFGAYLLSLARFACRMTA